MNPLKTTALSLAMIMLTGGAALAAGSGAMMKSDGAMHSDSMAASTMTMSAKDKKTMKSCGAMSHDKMMRTKACAAMAKMHPDAMKGDAMMQNGGAMSSDGMTAGK